METVSSWFEQSMTISRDMGSWTEKEPGAIGILIVPINFGEQFTILFSSHDFCHPCLMGCTGSRAASKPTAIVLKEDPIVGQHDRFGPNMPKTTGLGHAWYQKAKFCTQVLSKQLRSHGVTVSVSRGCVRATWSINSLKQEPSQSLGNAILEAMWATTGNYLYFPLFPPNVVTSPKSTRPICPRKIWNMSAILMPFWCTLSEDSKGTSQCTPEFSPAENPMISPWFPYDFHHWRHPCAKARRWWSRPSWPRPRFVTETRWNSEARNWG